MALVSTPTVEAFSEGGTELSVADLQTVLAAHRMPARVEAETQSWWFKTTPNAALSITTLLVVKPHIGPDQPARAKILLLADGSHVVYRVTSVRRIGHFLLLSTSVDGETRPWILSMGAGNRCLILPPSPYTMHFWHPSPVGSAETHLLSARRPYPEIGNR